MAAPRKGTSTRLACDPTAPICPDMIRQAVALRATLEQSYAHPLGGFVEDRTGGLPRGSIRETAPAPGVEGHI
jgi:hypothetical protein